MPIWKKGDEKGAVMEAVASVQNTLKEAGIRVKVDDSEMRTPGWKFNFYEMKVITFAFVVEFQFSLFFLFLPYRDNEIFMLPLCKSNLLYFLYFSLYCMAMCIKFCLSLI